eukprot:PITA_31687
MNKSLNMILQRTIDKNCSNWNLMLYPALWVCRTSVKTATGFTSFQLVCELESLFPIECKIPSLKLAIEILPETSSLEERLLHLEHLGNLVLVYDQDKDALGASKFKFMWYGPFIVKQVLGKGAYELVDFEGNNLEEPRNGLYLKKYFS